MSDFNSQADKAVKDKAIKDASMFANCFNNPAGEKVINHLKDKFVDVPMVVKGDDLLNAGLRQGQANLVRYIIKQLEIAKGAINE